MAYLFLYLAITVAGYFIGAKLSKKQISLPWVGRVQNLVIMFLIFVMGSRIGANEQIVSSLGTIGLIALAYTLIIFAFTTAAFWLVRKLLGFDRFGRRFTKAERQEMKEGGRPAFAEKEEAASAGINSLMVKILISVCIGVLAGYTVLPEAFIACTGWLLTVSLCALLLLIGVDIGMSGTLAENFRRASWRILLFPFVSIGAMIIGSVFAAMVLPIGVQDGICVGCGMAWYSLAPVMLAEYSMRVSAISFMHNVFREVLGLVFVPLVAKRVGYIECYGLPGSVAMDVCLPVIERSTSSDVAVYSFICGAICSVSVPITTGIFMSL